MTIIDNIQHIENQLPEQTKLIAVTKTKPVELLREAYDAGCRRFGENKVQEMVDKQPLLPADLEWHLIGHLQTNKVKYIAPFVSLIHSVDSLKVLQEINKQAARHNRVIDCLLQVHIAQEATKFGFDEDETESLLNSSDLAQLTNIRIVGLMGMATHTDDGSQIRREFRTLKRLYDRLSTIEQPNVQFQELSMGMSSDYLTAIEEGSTMVRVGSAIFGSRN